MNERYDYLTLRRGDNVPAAVAEAGGVIVGRWSGAAGMGWYDDELIVLVGWPEGTTPVPTPEAVPVRATARPTSVAPLTGGGVFAHRWFEFDPADWDEFLSLSSGAWPAFEAAYGATIEAFLRTDKEPQDAVLLITRYPSLAGWEESRGALSAAPGEDVAEAGRRFQRRRQLTRRTIVRTGTLLSP